MFSIRITFKKIFLVLFVVVALVGLTTSNSFSQRKDTSDYFTIGLYGGSYIGQKPLYERNKFINSVAVEFEYFKFEELSFYLQGLYQFTGTDVRRLFQIPERHNITRLRTPRTFRLSVSFGGRYYLRNKNVNPFFQAGISHETNYIGSYSYRVEEVIGPGDERGHSFTYKLSANLGAGLSIKLSSKFKLELKYDLYRSIIESANEFTGFSILGGVKYNL